MCLQLKGNYRKIKENKIIKLLVKVVTSTLFLSKPNFFRERINKSAHLDKLVLGSFSLQSCLVRNLSIIHSHVSKDNHFHLLSSFTYSGQITSLSASPRKQKTGKGILETYMVTCPSPHSLPTRDPTLLISLSFSGMFTPPTCSPS